MGDESPRCTVQHRSAKLATIAGAPYEANMGTLKFGTKTIALPASRMARIGIGIALIIGGMLGFLPILGFWMVPLGLLVLSMDIPAVRRWRRQFLVWLGPRLRMRFPWLAAKLGFGNHDSNGVTRPYRARME
jgi:hypothetical protein